ncbi:hypothetical protein [Xenorhabdus bovienii]|nr:hypothetical protein [Xenorhabdus bovienii]
MTKKSGDSRPTFDHMPVNARPTVPKQTTKEPPKPEQPPKQPNK